MRELVIDSFAGGGGASESIWSAREWKNRGACILETQNTEKETVCTPPILIGPNHSAPQIDFSCLASRAEHGVFKPNYSHVRPISGSADWIPACDTKINKELHLVHLRSGWTSAMHAHNKSNITRFFPVMHWCDSVRSSNVCNLHYSIGWLNEFNAVYLKWQPIIVVDGYRDLRYTIVHLDLLSLHPDVRIYIADGDSYLAPVDSDLFLHGYPCCNSCANCSECPEQCLISVEPEFKTIQDSILRRIAYRLLHKIRSTECILPRRDGERRHKEEHRSNEQIEAPAHAPLMLQKLVRPQGKDAAGGLIIHIYISKQSREHRHA